MLDSAAGFLECLYPLSLVELCRLAQVEPTCSASLAGALGNRLETLFGRAYG